MSNKNKANEPFYSLGQRFIDLGSALQDKRTSLDEISDLALQVGMHFNFWFSPKENTEQKNLEVS